MESRDKHLLPMTPLPPAIKATVKGLMAHILPHELWEVGWRITDSPHKYSETFSKKQSINSPDMNSKFADDSLMETRSYEMIKKKQN